MEKSKKCPTCGAENKEGAKYCEKCGTSLNSSIFNKTSNGRVSRNFRISGSRIFILLIPIAIIIGFYIFLLLTPTTPFSWNLLPGRNVTLPAGYYTFVYSNLSSVNATLSGKFTANITTIWAAGPSSIIFNFLQGNNTNLSSIQKYIIENTTSAAINITFPAGNYSVAVWGINFSSDKVVFPVGFNVTYSK